MDQVLAYRSRLRKRLYGWSWLQSRSAVSHPSIIHSSRSILHSDTVQFRKQFSHSSLCFLVDQVLAYRSRLRKRLYGWSWLQSRSAVSHPSIIHSSRSILHSDTVQFRKQFSHSSLCFLVDQVLAYRSRLRKRLYGWSWLQSRSAVSHPSLIHSSRSIQRSKTVQFPKQFSLSSLCFLVDQVLASQIKAEEETLWVKLTPKQDSC